MNLIDKHYMNLAIKEASKGKSNVYPNPRVGALIVKDEEIVSSGFHKKFGHPHAEYDAIKSIKGNISGATLYTTLEPCIHRGKTNACVELITPRIFKRVVIGSKDPNPIAGGGARQLREKGIQVDEGICHEDCKKLNRRFFTFHEKKRPYIILKIASTLDGFISEMNNNSKWITNKKSRKSVHQLRSTCDAILVGRKTVEIDNPYLTSHLEGKNPKVITFDKNNTLNSKANIFKNNPIILSKKDILNDPKKNINNILNFLYDNYFQTLLVEGGGITFTHFLKEKKFDELQCYFAPKVLGQGLSFYNEKGFLDTDLELEVHKIQNFDSDVKITYYKR